MNLFEFRNVYFAYLDEDYVIKDINLSVEEGEFIILLGPNGCGKTTLLKHFNGLLKPTKGQVLFMSKDINSYRSYEIFSKVGFLFQDPNDQIFAATVEEDVSFGPNNLGLPKDEIESRIEEALSKVGILNLRKKRISELSLGQKQRVAIAGVLATRPNILILDEPTSSLDPQTQKELMDLLKNSMKKE
ncbi:MAG: energy-coupling factor ABC transporter ATP-binding protein [Brevinematia bacterium]